MDSAKTKAFGTRFCGSLALLLAYSWALWFAAWLASFPGDAVTKLPQTEWLETKEIYSVPMLEARVQDQINRPEALALQPEPQGENQSSPALVSGSTCLHRPSLCPVSTSPAPLCLLGGRQLLDLRPNRHHLEILPQLYLQGSLNKIRCSGDWDMNIPSGEPQSNRNCGWPTQAIPLRAWSIRFLTLLRHRFPSGLNAWEWVPQIGSPAVSRPPCLWKACVRVRRVGGCQLSLGRGNPRSPVTLTGCLFLFEVPSL